MLIVVNEFSQAEKILGFARQIAVRADEPPDLLIINDRNHRNLNYQVEQIVNQAEKLLEPQQLSTRVRIGDPGKVILQDAREGDYDLLIMGEIQATHLPPLFNAFRTAQIAEGVPCPVIIVKGVTRLIRRILLCDSGAGKSSLLSRFTAKLAEMLEGEEEVAVLHVMSQISARPGVHDRDLLASVDELIESQTPEGELLTYDIQVLTRSGIHPIPMVRHGLVVDEILDEARRGDYDLIVIGAHQGKDWQRYLLEDFTRQILVNADRPVMVVT